MRKSKKKLLTLALASAMVTSVLPMTAFAADSTGELIVNVGVKAPILRVSVPTSLAVSIDEYEMVETGNQIFSQDFTIKNFSDSAVKVDINSTLESDSNVTDLELVDSKDAAIAGTGKKAWVAAVAAVGKDTNTIKYINGADKTVADINEKDINVATFKMNDSVNEAKQNFYLDKATVTGAYVIDTGANIAQATNVKEYTQFYELTEIIQGSESSLLDAVNKAIVKGDVYSVKGTTVTKINMGDTISAADADKYYSVANEVTTYTDAITNTSKSYVYIDDSKATAAAEQSEAGFRYIGALSKQDGVAWTKDDIKTINIAYNITSVSTTDYDAMKDAPEHVYGYYPLPREVSVTNPTATSKMAVTATAYALDYDLGFGAPAAKGITSVVAKAGTTELPLTLKTHYNIDTSNKVITLIPNKIAALKVDNVLLSAANSTVTSLDFVVTFDNGEKRTVTIGLQR